MTDRRMRRRTVGRRKQEADPGLGVLLVQAGICGVAVAVSLGLSAAAPPILPVVAAQVQTLVTAEQVQIPTEVTDYLSERCEALWNRAQESVSGWIALLIKDNRSSPVQGDPEAVEQNRTQELEGAGGWMGEKDAAAVSKQPPSSCSIAPLVSAAAVEPPVSGRVTSFYGYRVHPLTKTDDFHRGLDIAAPSGAGIYTPLPGRVAEIGSSAIYGNYITLDHGSGCRTTYSHCAEIVAEEGANLRQGELVARVGSTGISTGPHLHFEIQKNGVYYNPAWVVNGMDGYGV